ncbi:MAG: hypothetical protein WCF65_01700 [Parachlamydiaceae bacterium]
MKYSEKSSHLRLAEDETTSPNILFSKEKFNWSTKGILFILPHPAHPVIIFFDQKSVELQGALGGVALNPPLSYYPDRKGNDQYRGHIHE